MKRLSLFVRLFFLSEKLARSLRRKTLAAKVTLGKDRWTKL